jgi:RNA polymerase sigma factor (sigma-70 family)
LLRRLRGGDQSALDEIYRAYQPRLLTFCRHVLGNAQEAEDAVQQTFLAAHITLPYERLGNSLGAWLFTVARRKCIDIIRRRRPADELPDDAPALDGLAAEIERREDLRQLVDGVRQLDYEHRAALVLTQMEALSQA